MSESHGSTTITLHRHTCGRSAGTGPNGVETFRYQEQEWCGRCARVIRPSVREGFVLQPSPGRMTRGSSIDPLDAWRDCYDMKPKRRIKKGEAKREIQRAWTMRSDDNGGSEAMFAFFAWLKRNRPYFLTFRYRGDLWQTVHSWLLQFQLATQEVARGQNQEPSAEER